ncbi:hypothetical protein [Ruegeria atlantica]|uniref:hypothetical protein n=1 Tax=Ruegeria atlantica TaxID=81569 RepID=UPI0034A087E5
MQNRKSRVSEWMTAFRFLPAMALIVACAPQDMPPPTRSAQFETYPERLFDTFETQCAGPGEKFEKVGNRVFECQEFLPPDTTAFLILNYDGYPQDLPKSVMRMTSTKNTTGYRVDAELFFNVPQKQGPAVKVPVESKALDQALGALFQKMGGSLT